MEQLAAAELLRLGLGERWRWLDLGTIQAVLEADGLQVHFKR